MTYIELINEFWRQDRFKSFNEIDTRFYFFLLNECNFRNWLNPFELQTSYLEALLQIKRKAIGEARNRLKQRGLIDFKSKSNNPTLYTILNLDISNELFLDRNNTETIGKQSQVQSGNNRETYISDLKSKDKDKEKPPKGGKKKENASPFELVRIYRETSRNEAFLKFLDWVESSAPYVAENIQPLSEAEFLKLKSLYGSETIGKNVLNIENRKDLRKRYNSLYLTLNNWCKNELA